jgi:hypothetical protein
MKLFKISQSENRDCDTYDSAVVCCDTAEEACNMNPADGSPMDWSISTRYTGWCSGPEHVTVQCIGETDHTIVPYVVLASFNAG